VAKAVVDSALNGEPQRLASFNARFTGHVFPGETLITRIWDEGDGLIVEAGIKERETTVLSYALVTVRS
jgi:hypothetical protein